MRTCNEKRPQTSYNHHSLEQLNNILSQNRDHRSSRKWHSLTTCKWTFDQSQYCISGGCIPGENEPVKYDGATRLAGCLAFCDALDALVSCFGVGRSTSIGTLRVTRVGFDSWKKYRWVAVPAWTLLPLLSFRKVLGFVISFSFPLAAVCKMSPLFILVLLCKAIKVKLHNVTMCSCTRDFVDNDI